MDHVIKTILIELKSLTLVSPDKDFTSQNFLIVRPQGCIATDSTSSGFDVWQDFLVIYS